MKMKFQALEELWNLGVSDEQIEELLVQAGGPILEVKKLTSEFSAYKTERRAEEVKEWKTDWIFDQSIYLVLALLGTTGLGLFSYVLWLLVSNQAPGWLVAIFMVIVIGLGFAVKAAVEITLEEGQL